VPTDCKGASFDAAPPGSHPTNIGGNAAGHSLAMRNLFVFWPDGRTSLSTAGISRAMPKIGALQDPPKTTLCAEGVR